MANFRQVHCRMWSSDNWFIELKPDMKLLFIYLFTNERATMCGLYELPIRIMSFETGLDRDTVTQGLEFFTKADKVKYDFETGVVWVRNAIKYQSPNPNEKILARIKADIKAVPDCALKRECMDTLSIPYEYGNDASVSVSYKSTVSVSEERGGTGEKTRKPALDLFAGYFGKFKSDNEISRWLVLFDVVGKKQAEELAVWASKKEIHLLNRPSLLDSLETAAKNWYARGNGANGKTEKLPKGAEAALNWLSKKKSQEAPHG